MSEPSPVPEQPQAVPQAPKDERLWVTLCHLAAVSGYIGVPFGWIVGPLVVWLIKRNEIPLVDRHGKNALNFQISMTLYGFACVPFIFVLIGIPLLLAVGILDIVCIIMASVKASNGEEFKYPLSIQFIK